MTRRRYIYREVAPGQVEAFEVGAEWSDTPVSTGDLGKFEYDNLRTTDGVDISSRTKRREYMKATGAADARDYREAGPKARAERAAHHNVETKAQLEDMRRDVYRAIQDVRSGRARRRRDE